MNKWFAGLMVCGLACGLAACSDDDNKGGNCLSEEPKLVVEAGKLDTAVKADGVTFTQVADPENQSVMLDVASDCEKFAVNLNNYLNAGEGDEAGQNAMNLFDAIKDYPKFSGSLAGVLCGLLDTTKTLQASAKVKKVWDVGTNCIRVHGSDMNAEAKSNLDASLGKFKTAEGWNNVLEAAASEAVKQEQSNP